MKEYKMAVMGTSGVGKTSMIRQFVEGYFSEGYGDVIEDSYRKSIIHRNNECRIDLYDAGGLDTFAQMMKIYIENSDGFILVYSIADYKTFEDIQTIREQIVSFKSTEQVPIVLVGNKGDLAVDSRAVETSVAADLAAKWPNSRFIETSARNHEEIESVFIHCLDTMEELQCEKQQHSTAETLAKKASGKNKCKCSVM